MKISYFQKFGASTFIHSFILHAHYILFIYHSEPIIRLIL